MRRDASSELLVALIAVGILALALVFGLVLTLSQRADAAPTQTAQAQIAQADSATPAATASPSATSTDPPTPTSTASQTPTSPASLTPRPTEPPATTLTAAPSPTETLAATGTNTATTTQTASATLTPTPSPTQTATATRTNTATSTRTASATSTPTPSRTPSPTLTQTPSPTFTVSATFTPSRTPTPTLFVPTLPPELLTPTPTPPGAAQLAQTPCVPRRDWIPHTVQVGETLFSLARRAQISLAELARANCIADPSRLVVGSVIYVPRPLATPTPMALIGVNIRNCADPQRRILNVPPDGRLSGVFNIIGTAQDANFQFYKVEIRAEASAVWQNLITRSTPIEGGVLAELNTALFPEGVYWLRLTVVDVTGNFPPPCEVRVILAP